LYLEIFNIEIPQGKFLVLIMTTLLLSKGKKIDLLSALHKTYDLFFSSAKVHKIGDPK
jgi:hypothetical protein